MAILAALRKVADDCAILIRSDLKIIINSITFNLKYREDCGWTGIANKHILKALVAELRHHKGVTFIEKVKGHAGTEGNEEANKLANEGTSKERLD